MPMIPFYERNPTMISRRSLCVLALAAVALVLPGRFAAADDAPPKIATVDTGRVFREMLETKDLKQKIESDNKVLGDEKTRRDADLKEAQKNRELYNEGTAEFDKANQAVIEKLISMEIWGKLVTADQQRQQKVQIRNLYNKINEATKEVAEQKKLDLVLVDQKIELPKDSMEKMPIEQLQQIINQRSVMYNNLKLDITNEVLAAVDAKYKARK